MARRVAYIHHLSGLSEKTVKAICATANLGGFTEICYKISQGTGWMAPKFDTSPLAPQNPTQLRTLVAAFAAEGIRLTGWHVPDGSNVTAEASFIAKVASALGEQIELDIEPFAGFWDGPKANLNPLLDALVARHIVFDIDFDARASSGGYSDFGIPAFTTALKKARAVFTQSYWTDFERPAVSTVRAAVTTCRETLDYHGPLGVIFPWDGTTDYLAAAAALAQLDVTALGMWRTGLAPLATYTAFAKIPTPMAELPLPIPIVTESLHTLWRIAAVVRQLEHGTQAAQIEKEVGVIKDALAIL